jgi:succinyl-diaminopimelate desuccinylase
VSAADAAGSRGATDPDAAARIAAAASRVVDLDGADLLGLTAALVDIPSVSRDEARLADLVERRLGVRAPRLVLDRVDDTVVARTDLGRPSRIVLAGHLDTVPVNGNDVARRDGDRLAGLGTADMKGGLAVMLRLAEEVSRQPERFRHDVTFVLYEAEEIADEFNGLRKLFERRPDLPIGDFAIALEPTDGWLEAGCQGTIHVRATFHGARAHTARPWMGTNAVHAAAPLVEHVAAFGNPTVVVDGLEYRESLQVVEIVGGVARYVVPDRCSVVVNRRFAPACSLDEAVADTLARLAAAADPAPDLEVVGASPGAHPNLTHPLVAAFASDLGLDVRPKLGWTDVARFAAHGVPAVNFGPGDAAIAHTAGEWVRGASIERCHRVLAAFLTAGD